MEQSEVQATPPALTTRRPSPAAAGARAVLSLLVIALIFRLLLSNVDFGDVWATIRDLRPLTVVALLVGMVGAEALKARIPATILPKLGAARSFVAEETSGVMSKALPGPSGTAARFSIYRSFGITFEEFSTAAVVNSLVNNAFTLLLPAVVLVPFIVQGLVPGAIVGVAAVGVAVSVGGLALVGAIARSETLARRIGLAAGRFLTWFRGLRKRPPPDDLGDAIVHFRDTAVTTLRDTWRRLVPLMLAKYVITAAILYVALRAVGLGADDVTFYQIFAVLVLAGILTMIEVTPGGLGVTEVVYIKLLLLVTGPDANDAVVAGVLLFRGVTYLGPMVLGIGSYVVWRRKKDWRADGATASPSLALAGFEPEPSAGS